MALCEKILIAGFSGAGKSSFLPFLQHSAPENWELFDDLDQLVLKNWGENHCDLSALIAEAGWEQFRLWERVELEKWLKVETKGVLALGGGTLSPLLWDLYRRSSRIKFCYLRSEFETCWARLELSPEVRPLVLRGKSELQKIYHERQQLFNQIPWVLLNEGQRSREELALEFWQKLTD